MDVRKAQGGEQGPALCQSGEGISRPRQPRRNTVSMEEAVEQAEREDGPSGAESVARTHPKQDDSSAASDPGMDG